MSRQHAGAELWTPGPIEKVQERAAHSLHCQPDRIATQFNLEGAWKRGSRFHRSKTRELRLAGHSRGETGYHWGCATARKRLLLSEWRPQQPTRLPPAVRDPQAWIWGRISRPQISGEKSVRRFRQTGTRCLGQDRSLTAAWCRSTEPGLIVGGRRSGLQWPESLLLGVEQQQKRSMRVSSGREFPKVDASCRNRKRAEYQCGNVWYNIVVCTENKITRILIISLTVRCVIMRI